MLVRQLFGLLIMRQATIGLVHHDIKKCVSKLCV